MAELDRRKRIGIYGGAFDPPHLAHQTLLLSAVAQLGLDELRVIPTGQAWHKTRVLTASIHRLAMAQLAFDGLPGVVVDAQEIRRGGPSYTIDTLRSIAREQPGADLFLLVGADQARALTTWHAWQEIVRHATIAVAERSDTSQAVNLFEAEKSFPERFIHLAMPAMTLSSTQIRDKISQRLAVSTLVCESVARYIADHHLYQTD